MTLEDNLISSFSLDKEARILKARVEIKGDKRIKDTLKLAASNQPILEVGVRYERLGVFCTYCSHLGHESRNCQMLIEDAAQDNLKEDMLGEWIKADQVGKQLLGK
ncbi:hypothetical protein PIB30_044300 [Stylosanthes scabra]|uniref:Zinc knuckle CX2CX4HX4C domain-containing protein n=1 Tax=Stylosanthes scabra TaxID=79078 RepID=A0ABU6VEB0_9FABA|nr:hypothetical protein [Stylosanthes scabra]